MTPLATVEFWRPQEGPQALAITAGAFVDELFFGGARGGGKSDFLLGDFAQDIDQGATWQGILLRRSYPELDELIQRSHQLYPQLGAQWREGKKEWTFPSGARLQMRHMDSDLDFVHYQGHSFAWIGFDELPNWPNLIHYHKMKSCLRGPALHKRMRATGNPGGVGHLPVKKYFIDLDPQGLHLVEGEDGMKRMFIPSKVADNKILLASDPGYIERLKGVGDPQLVKAWLEGDWNAMIGQYFVNWHEHEILEDSFELPDHWTLFGCLDYGETAPTSFHLLSVDYDHQTHVVGEYYVAGRAASEHAAGINQMINNNPWTGGRRPSQIFADPSMFTKKRLRETVQTSPADVFLEEGLYLKAGNNDRVTGWRVINDALVKKRLKIFNGWADNLQRTAPAAPRDRANPEDVDTHCEDHALDSLRYGLMQVYGKRKVIPKKVIPLNAGQRVMDLVNRPRLRNKYG